MSAVRRLFFFCRRPAEVGLFYILLKFLSLCFHQFFNIAIFVTDHYDIVNIGLHFFLKDVRPMLPPVMNRSIVDA